MIMLSIYAFYLFIIILISLMNRSENVDATFHSENVDTTFCFVCVVLFLFAFHLYSILTFFLLLYRLFPIKIHQLKNYFMFKNYLKSYR